jgi:hypothetical protein
MLARCDEKCSDDDRREVRRPHRHRGWPDVRRMVVAANREQQVAEKLTRG